MATNTNTQALERMLSQGRDSAMLRLTLGNAYAGQGDFDRALEHLLKAVEMEPGYSAAWKALGQLHRDHGEAAQAAAAWRQGLAVARDKGDMQVVRELEVFLRKLTKDSRQG